MIMNRRKYIGYAILVFCIITAGLYFLSGHICREAEVDISAKCAVIMEAESGEILFDKNADKRFPPASTSKIMTAIIAVENIPLNAEIISSSQAVDVEPVTAGLNSGVKYRLKDLLAAILIKSGNDAANVIAEGVAGSEEKFSYLMNAKAEEIGMKDTYFANASGLPTGERDIQYITAKDLACMMRYALNNRTILDTMSKKDAKIYGSDGQEIYLRTHNKTLLSGDEEFWGKTGYTREAKRTFVGIDPSFNPRIIIALLQCADLWDDISILRSLGLKIYERRHRALFFNIYKRISHKI